MQTNKHPATMPAAIRTDKAVSTPKYSELCPERFEISGDVVSIEGLEVCIRLHVSQVLQTKLVPGQISHAEQMVCDPGHVAIGSVVLGGAVAEDADESSSM
jgi:hypothetical protein